jgi:hypothetical protein
MCPLKTTTGKKGSKTVNKTLTLRAMTNRNANALYSTLYLGFATNIPQYFRKHCKSSLDL